MRVSVRRVPRHRQSVKVVFALTHRPTSHEIDLCSIVRDVVPRVAGFRDLIIRSPASRSARGATCNKRTLAASRLIECLHHPTNDHCVSSTENKIRKVGISSSRVEQSVTGVTSDYVGSVIGVITNVGSS